MACQFSIDNGPYCAFLQWNESDNGEIHKKKTVIEKSSFIMRKCGVAPPSNARTINIYSLTNWNTARPNPQISFANRCKAVIGMLAKHHTKQGCQNEHEETWRKERKLYYQGYKRDFLRFSNFHLQLSVRFFF